MGDDAPRLVIISPLDSDPWNGMAFDFVKNRLAAISFVRAEITKETALTVTQRVLNRLSNCMESPPACGCTAKALPAWHPC
jgi:hypothetical protein